MQNLFRSLILQKYEFRKDILFLHYPEAHEVYSPSFLSAASAINKAGFSYEYISGAFFTAKTPEERIQIIKAYEPLVCVFNISKMIERQIKKEIKRIKTKLPKIKILLFSNEIPPEEKRQNVDCDTWAAGDLETILPDYLTVLKKMPSAPPPNIIGPKYAESEKETVALDFNEITLRPYMPYFSSRGENKLGILSFKRKRAKMLYSPERVLEEISQLLKSNVVKHISILDPNFMDDKNRLKKILDGIMEFRKQDATAFSCLADLKFLSENPDYLLLLKQAGFKVIILPVLSTDQQVEQLYGNCGSAEFLKKIVKQAALIKGIIIKAIFTIGTPYETKESLEKTLELSEQLTEIYPCGFEPALTYFYPIPNTFSEDFISENNENTLEKGKVYSSDPEWLSISDLSSPIYYTADLSLIEQERLYEKFVSKITKIMKRQALNLSFEEVAFHIELYKKFQISDFCFTNIIGKSYLINRYFSLMEKPIFLRLSQTPPHLVGSLTPVRIILEDNYIPSETGYLIKGYLEDIEINSEEAAVYEYSTGKLKIDDIAKRLSKELPKNLTPEEIKEKIMIPFLLKMEDTYHMVFFR